MGTPKIFQLQVETSLGIINGVSLVESHGFYRIPFAKAPINETR